MKDPVPEYEAIPVTDTSRADDVVVRPRRPTETLEDFVTSARDFATKVPATIGRAIEKVVQAGEHTILVRVNEVTLAKIDTLIDAGIFKSRSDAASFLLSEGIKSQQALFDRIEAKVAEIDRIRAELRNIPIE
ncbi:MAG TPA: hypothetical protein VFC63_23285 [Blastocatellia bacterium]|nr:hypothetical protein [Blastocatellia bacterium]